MVCSVYDYCYYIFLNVAAMFIPWHSDSLYMAN